MGGERERETTNAADIRGEWEMVPHRQRRVPQASHPAEREIEADERWSFSGS